MPFTFIVYLEKTAFLALINHFCAKRCRKVPNHYERFISKKRSKTLITYFIEFYLVRLIAVCTDTAKPVILKNLIALL